MNIPIDLFSKSDREFGSDRPLSDFKPLSKNKRTIGPVNAHLRPEIYTNKLV